MARHMPISAPVIDPANWKITDVWQGFFRDLTGTTSGSSGTIAAGSVGTTELADEAVTFAKLATQLLKVTGTRAAPTSITAAGGVAPSGKWFEVMFVQGSGGAVDITANPQIAAGTSVGQLLLLIGRGNGLTLDDGTGLSQNGSITLDADDAVLYMWDGTNWVEIVRSDKS